MDDEQFKKLIKEADKSPAVQLETSELSGRVYLLYRKRERQRLTLAAGLLVVCGIVAWIGVTAKQGGEIVQSDPDVQHENIILSTSQEIEEIKYQIKQQEMLVATLIMAEKRQQFDKLQETMKSNVDNRILRELQAGRAAATILMCADNRAKAADGISVAREDYKHVIQVFPNTIWARQAEEKLATLNP